MDIYLLRHTPVYNPNKLCYGQAEIPLEENFTSDFNWIEENLSHALATNSIVYSSSLRRCTKLANYLTDSNFVIDERIKELNFGDWELQPWDTINPKQINPWMADFVNYTVPKGESFIDLANRSVEFWNEVKENEIHENIIVVTHAGVIRAMLAHILDFPLKNAFDIQIDYSSIAKISYQKKYDKQTVVYINKTQ